jgi:hypothetical protein
VLAEALRPAAGERFPEGCDETTCFLRLNRYPPCPVSPPDGASFGLVPHTDSDFLTVLCQDHVGGLQLMKGAGWVAVKPIPGALIVNVGDLFQVRTRAHTITLLPASCSIPFRLPPMRRRRPSPQQLDLVKAISYLVFCARGASGTKILFIR